MKPTTAPKVTKKGRPRRQARIRDKIDHRREARGEKESAAPAKTEPKPVKRQRVNRRMGLSPIKKGRSGERAGCPDLVDFSGGRRLDYFFVAPDR